MPSLGGAIRRDRSALLAEARAECDRQDAAASLAVARLFAEARARKHIFGADLRAAIIEALSYASEADPADRVRVHVVECHRATAAAAADVLASLGRDDWAAVVSARAAWSAREVAGPARPVRRAYLPNDRTLALLDAAASARSRGLGSVAWVRECQAAGMSRAAAYRWWKAAA